MNGIEKITAQIQKDVQSEIDALLKQAQEESAAIQADYKAKAAALQQDILAKGQQAAEERIERQTRAAELEARKLLLQTKQEKIDDSFRRAHAALPSDRAHRNIPAAPGVFEKEKSLKTVPNKNASLAEFPKECAIRNVSGPDQRLMNQHAAP